MFASRARRIALVAIVSLTLIVGLVPAAAAADAAPIPTSMAAVGDSITRAASTGGTLGEDAPANSWSTGTNSTVNSHALRLQITGSAHNLAVSGAKVGNLNAQMQNVASLAPDPGYLTVLIGGNDLCTDTVESMTSEAAFRSAFEQAMATVTSGSPDTYVYVVSIPDVYQLWELFKSNFFARLVWSSANICQSLLANPTSTKKQDVDRRNEVRARNIAYNAILADVCGDYPARCRHDGGAVFGTQLQRSDVSGDYFHPSISGQARLAAVSWDAGYTFGAPPPPPENQAPTASFSASCAELTCDFDGSASTDGDGTVTGYSWDFGDGSTLASGVSASHTYAAGGTYTVALTVTDDDDATDTHLASVTVGEATPMHVADLDGDFQAKGKSAKWEAFVTVTVRDAGGNPVDGAAVSGTWGGALTGTVSGGTSSNGTVTFSTGALSSGTSVTFTVTDVVRDGFAYTGSNTDPDNDSDGTTITVSR